MKVMADKLNKSDYQENTESLITFGDEGQTLRADDPRTKEYVDRLTKENLEKVEKAAKVKENENRSLFDGLNLSGKRGDDETYEEYVDRRKTNKMFMKVYKQEGRDQCWEMFPEGFKSVLGSMEMMKKKSKQPKYTAEMVNEDGTKTPITLDEAADVLKTDEK